MLRPRSGDPPRRGRSSKPWGGAARARAAADRGRRHARPGVRGAARRSGRAAALGDRGAGAASSRQRRPPRPPAGRDVGCDRGGPACRRDPPRRAAGVRGPARFSRRSATYRELAAVADLVLVSSTHEARCLRALGAAAPIRVVDHPIDARPARVRPATDWSVGVLGWIHPGKGHAHVLDAMAAALPGGTLVALGAPVTGHADLVETLTRQAHAVGVGFRVTGYLDDDALLEQAGRVAVPVCAHRHISASGTIGTWMTAGRAPIVTPGPYARGVLDRCPGSLTLAASLPAALRAAARDPSSTLLARPQDIVPTTEQAAGRQAAVLREWLEG